MAIERWDPFREVVSLRDAVNSLLQESFVRPGNRPATGGPATLPLDVAETATEFVIKASLPGIEPGGRADHRLWRHADDPGRGQGRGADQDRKLIGAGRSEAEGVGQDLG